MHREMHRSRKKFNSKVADWSEGTQVACWLDAAECVHSTEVLSLVYILRNHVSRACWWLCFVSASTAQRFFRLCICCATTWAARADGSASCVRPQHRGSFACVYVAQPREPHVLMALLRECVHSTEVLSLVYTLRNHVSRACWWLCFVCASTAQRFFRLCICCATTWAARADGSASWVRPQHRGSFACVYVAQPREPPRADGCGSCGCNLWRSGFHLPLTVTIGSLNTSLRDAWRDAS